MLVEGEINHPPLTRANWKRAERAWSGPSATCDTSTGQETKWTTSSWSQRLFAPTLPANSGGKSQNQNLTTLSLLIIALLLAKVLWYSSHFHLLIVSFIFIYLTSCAWLFSSLFFDWLWLASHFFTSHTFRSSRPSVRSSFLRRSLLQRRIVLVAMLLVATLAFEGPSVKAFSPENYSPSTHSDKLRLKVQKDLLTMMGLEAVPNPADHHKVPDYMLDLYHYFQPGPILPQIDKKVNDKYRSPVGSLLGLTSEDLREISASKNNIDNAHVIHFSQHPRVVARKKRETQKSRVTLQGPANTVMSHKSSISNRVKTRTKRSTRVRDHEEAHLKFEVHMLPDEHLKGAELRLYRHSIYEDELDSQRTKQAPSESHSVRHQIKTDSSEKSVMSPSTSSHTNNKYSSTSQDEQYLQRINIYHLLRPIEEVSSSETEWHESEHSVSRLIDTQVVDVRQSGWLSFDVFPAVDRWVKHPNENFGLLVETTDYMGRHHSQHSHLLVLQPDNILVQSNSDHHRRSQTGQQDESSAWHEVQPLLISFSNTARVEKHSLIRRKELLHQKKRQNRSKREFPITRPKGNGNSTGKSKGKKKYRPSAKRRRFCSRFPLYFDFKDAGWNDWIVAPPGFQTFYCRGECSYPLSDHMNTTNHAIIQSLLNSINPAVVPEPCCVPTDLSPITMLYLDQHDKVVLKNYHDMVVEGCGCS